MRKLPRPTYVFADTYDLCASGVQNDIAGLATPAIRDQVIALAQQYDACAQAGTLFQLPACSSSFNAVAEAALKSLYGAQLRRANSRARVIYNSLLASAPLRRCPICGVGIVRTLDHYLPQSYFGQFSVLPLNLVPACRDCNTNKLDAAFNNAGEQPLHAYYDDYGASLWLRASVLPGNPPAADFFVDAAGVWGATAQARLEAHLKCFGLVDLFISNAADELSMLEDRLRRLANEGGIAAVTRHLEEEATLNFRERGNSWQSALYRALAESNWYCSRFTV